VIPSGVRTKENNAAWRDGTDRHRRSVGRERINFLVLSSRGLIIKSSGHRPEYRGYNQRDRVLPKGDARMARKSTTKEVQAN